MQSYYCYHKDRREWGKLVNADRPSRARYFYWLDLTECWEGLKLIDIRSLKHNSKPISSDSFLKNAEYRGIPWTRVGQKCRLYDNNGNGHTGVIVGHNSSANLDVYFLEGPNKGFTFNCHPGWRLIICIDEV